VYGFSSFELTLNFLNQEEAFRGKVNAMDNLLATLAYILIFGGVYALAVWFGPRYKYRQTMASSSNPQPLAPVATPEPEANQATPQTNEDAAIDLTLSTPGTIPESEADLLAPSTNRNTATALTPSAPTPISEPEDNLLASTTNVDTATALAPSAPTPISKPEANLTASPLNGETSIILTPSGEPDPMEQQAFTQAIGMLKSQGMEVEALDLEQEISIHDLMKSPPTLENREALLQHSKTR